MVGFSLQTPASGNEWGVSVLISVSSVGGREGGSGPDKVSTVTDLQTLPGDGDYSPRQPWRQRQTHNNTLVAGTGIDILL